MKPFCKLADPHGYVACDWDFSVDAAAREYWVDFFVKHVETVLRVGVEAAVARGEALEAARGRAGACREAFAANFERYARNHNEFGRVTILTLDEWRDQIVRRHGFVDPFIDVKERENAKMLPLLPTLCREIDALPAPLEQLRAVIEGLFAGNIFDMGAAATAKAFASGSPDFFNIRATLPKRPWLIDDFDAFETRMVAGPVHRRAVFFIDNAGSDFMLGALPMIRWLAQRGTHVVIAANERPSLNDMTIHDVLAWWPKVVRAEPSFASLPLELASTGTGEPLIDLSRVSDDLNAASADADLVILEGMGRGVESNLDARFTCDALRVAMIKDEMVAARCGGKVFDVVCRFVDAPKVRA
jgi:type II pantothenate kinase